MPHLARFALQLLVVAGLPLAGCQSPESISGTSLRVAPDQYEAAFAAAAEVLSDHGLSPAVRDRRTGVIETDARDSAGWFTPWNVEPQSSLEGVATLSTVRRRARVTFRPETFSPADADRSLEGPDLFGLRETPADVGSVEAPIELRIAVFVERTHRPGLRVDTWSRRLVSQARVARPGAAEGFEPGRTWWPVARDAGLERALLMEIAERLAPAS